MTRTGALIVIGVLIILLPFSGLPSGFLTWVFVLCGVLTALIGASLRKANLAQPVSLPQTEAEQTVVPLETIPVQPSQIS